MQNALLTASLMSRIFAVFRVPYIPIIQGTMIRTGFWRGLPLVFASTLIPLSSLLGPVVHLPNVLWLVIVVPNRKVRIGSGCDFSRLEALSDHLALIVVAIGSTNRV